MTDQPTSQPERERGGRMSPIKRPTTIQHLMMIKRQLESGVRLRVVPQHPHHAVTDDGRMFSLHDGDGIRPRVHRLKGYRTRGGYKGVLMTAENKRTKIHRLVLEAFVGSCPKGMETRHLDGDVHNNRLENLCWGTRCENAQDKIRHGRSHDQSGEKGPGARLKWGDVREIRSLFDAGVRGTVIARKHGISDTRAYRIRDKVTWRESDEQRS